MQKNHNSVELQIKGCNGNVIKTVGLQALHRTTILTH